MNPLKKWAHAIKMEAAPRVVGHTNFTVSGVVYSGPVYSSSVVPVRGTLWYSSTPESDAAAQYGFDPAKDTGNDMTGVRAVWEA